jgi:hypothetical protein
MKTSTNREIEIYAVQVNQSGYGHKEIRVSILFQGKYSAETMDFKAVTNNMPGYDAANDLEGEERRNALYSLIERQIIDEVEDFCSFNS